MFTALRTQLQGAATEFAGGPDALEGILLGMVDDVDRAVREPLEIFPVCHHSPASALAMARRLRGEAAQGGVPGTVRGHGAAADRAAQLLTPRRGAGVRGRDRQLPQEWAPLSVVAPITEASAEYQAIAYALDTPGVELVLVDRSSDHVFQWDRATAMKATETDGSPAEAEEAPRSEEAALHGEAVGVEIGDLRPRFAELEEHLLRHGKVRHWSEWWHQYVEVPLGDSDHDTYRQVMFLIGSLFRRLAPGDGDRVQVDEDRERYMWTRMREHLTATGTDPEDCVYVCGAFHAASRVEEFGVAKPLGRVHDLPAHGDHLAVRTDPVESRGDRGAVRAGGGVGVDRGDAVAEEPDADAGAALPAGGPGGRAEVPREEGAARRRSGRPSARHGPADRLPAPAARAGLPGRGGAAGLVRGHRAGGPAQRVPRVDRRRHCRVRDVDPARGDAGPGEADPVRLPGRGGHLHREGQRAGAQGRAPTRRDHDGRRPDRAGGLRGAATARPGRVRPAGATRAEAATARCAAGVAGHRPYRSWRRARTCCGCCGG